MLHFCYFDDVIAHVLPEIDRQAILAGLTDDSDESDHGKNKIIIFNCHKQAHRKINGKINIAYRKLV